MLPHTGDAFLAVTGAAKIKVLDRDGTERGESVQGDMYIRDQRNTKGHVSPCTYGHWHPTDRHGVPACKTEPWPIHDRHWSWTFAQHTLGGLLPPTEDSYRMPCSFRRI